MANIKSIGGNPIVPAAVEPNSVTDAMLVQTGGVLTKISELINAKSIDLSAVNTWEIGSIDPVTGNNTASDTRLRTKGHIAISEFTNFYATVESGYKYRVYYYDIAKAHIGNITWSTTSESIAVPNSAAYIRLLLAGTSDNAADVSMSENLALTVDYGLKSTLDAMSDDIDTFESVVAANSDDLYELGKKTVPCKIANGTAANPANANYVTTAQYIEIENGQTVRCVVDKALQAGQYFGYGYMIYDENMAVVNELPISSSQKSDFVVVPYANAKYIRWNIGVYESNGTVIPQRVSTFNGTVAVEVCGDVVTRNSDVLINAKASCKRGLAYTYGGVDYDSKLLSMLFVTDLHESMYAINNAVKYLNAMDFIDMGICLGDMGDYVASSGLWYTSRVNMSEKPFYTILGNHDLGNSKSASYGATVTQAFDKWIEPTLGTMEMQSLSVPYYMVTNDKHKVSIAFLNNYDVPDNVDGSGDYVVNRGFEVYTQTQVDWLIAQLDNIPTNYTLVIVMHSFPYANSGVESNFTQIGKSLAGNGVACYTELIPDIVNAWKNGSSLVETYEPNVDGVTESLSVDHSFASRGQGLFACYFVGHSHRDVVAKSTTYPDQIAIGFAASATNNYYNRNADLPRIFGEKSEDVITLAGIDTENKRINLCRIGSNVTTTMVDRTMTSLSYD